MKKLCSITLEKAAEILLIAKQDIINMKALYNKPAAGGKQNVQYYDFGAEFKIKVKVVNNNPDDIEEVMYLISTSSSKPYGMFFLSCCITHKGSGMISKLKNNDVYASGVGPGLKNQFHSEDGELTAKNAQISVGVNYYGGTVSCAINQTRMMLNAAVAARFDKYNFSNVIRSTKDADVMVEEFSYTDSIKHMVNVKTHQNEDLALGEIAGCKIGSKWNCYQDEGLYSFSLKRSDKLKIYNEILYQFSTDENGVYDPNSVKLLEYISRADFEDGYPNYWITAKYDSDEEEYIVKIFSEGSDYAICFKLKDVTDEEVVKIVEANMKNVLAGEYKLFGKVCRKIQYYLSEDEC